MRINELERKIKKDKTIDLEECGHCNTTTRGVFTKHFPQKPITSRSSTMFFKKEKYCLTLPFQLKMEDLAAIFHNLGEYFNLFK